MRVPIYCVHEATAESGVSHYASNKNQHRVWMSELTQPDQQLEVEAS
jgi:hypothetical protein